MMITFTVEGKPFGKQRPQHSGKSGTTYTPNKTRQIEQLFAAAYRSKYKGFYFSSGSFLSLTVKAYMPIPKSKSKAIREEMRNGTIRPTVKPDWDNIGKLVADALNKVAYDDDKSIVEAVVEKFYSDNPRTVVILHEITN